MQVTESYLGRDSYPSIGSGINGKEPFPASVTHCDIDRLKLRGKKNSEVRIISPECNSNEHSVCLKDLTGELGVRANYWKQDLLFVRRNSLCLLMSGVEALTIVLGRSVKISSDSLRKVTDERF